MKFFSTRGKCIAKNAAAVIAKGLADDGGLFVPEIFPSVKEDLSKLLEMDYPERACFIIHKFLEEYDYLELLDACKKAYGRFEENDAAPVCKIDENLYILELFHGPTLAFKDIALTLLPYLLRKGCDLSDITEKILVLVATSGDTGKAALEGFKDANGIDINVFYPSAGVSDMQKMQMCTQEGNNVNVVAVEGNFDDCQTAVKRLFTDAEFNAKLKKDGVILSSANSINFGRLVPQISYYFSAYCDLVNSGDINLGEEIDFVVPTGNFGNILAGYYAKKMGLPVNKLICASNDNNVLTEFFVNGDYDINRKFFKTVSPSMDILISSNLERLIFEISGRNAELTRARMDELKSCGKYSVTIAEKTLIDTEFFGSCCNEQDCLKTIADFFDEYGYVLDTHTAVAVDVYTQYADYVGADTPTVILSTASPYKFPQSVYKGITGKGVKDAWKAAEKLEEETATPIPEQILSLKQKPIRFSKVVEKDQTDLAVLQFIDSRKNI